ncbi:hypothetical protein SUGI_0742690 [Cryptomeria japonica]|nr:hypothetical protein SUGI_0742690 [Cryptomeria japonica]
MNVDTSLIEPDSHPIRGFDNVAKSSLGIITLPITVGPVTLPIPIHVMSGNLTYNLLLGRPWIHGMQVVPSTLHRQVKFIYNNKTYTLIGDTNFQACLQTSTSKGSSSKPSSSSDDSLNKIPMDESLPSNNQNSLDESEAPEEDPSRLEYTHKKAFDPEKVLAEDDWGSLDFNPTFVGEYRVPPRELKVKKKEETRDQSVLPEPMSNNFVAASQTSSPHTSNSEEFDSLSYEKPPFLSEMANRYGCGFHILAKSGYSGNGCGANEQGIKVPLEHNMHEYSFGLGYNLSKPTKASKRPSLNVNAIFSSDDDLTSTKSSSTSINSHAPHKEILAMNKSLYDSPQISKSTYESLSPIHHKVLFSKDKALINYTHPSSKISCDFSSSIFIILYMFRDSDDAASCRSDESRQRLNNTPNCREKDQDRGVGCPGPARTGALGTLVPGTGAMGALVLLTDSIFSIFDSFFQSAKQQFLEQFQGQNQDSGARAPVPNIFSQILTPGIELASFHLSIATKE